MEKRTKIRIALPTGSLKETTLAILRNAGFLFDARERSYSLALLNDERFECMLVKPQEIGKFVERGFFDLGITGQDWLIETGAEVSVLARFPYSKRNMRPTRLVLAVPGASGASALADLENGVVATEFVNITRNFLKENGVAATVEFSWGATESKPSYLSDAIVDIVDTGASLAANGLRPLATIMESEVCVVTKRDPSSDMEKGARDFLGLFTGAFEGLSAGA